MAIDTWAVDYVLLDAQDRILGETYGYRDHRTDGMDAETAKILQETELYAKTGIQKQIFNTDLSADGSKTARRRNCYSGRRRFSCCRIILDSV